ncbi:MAG TPA: molybdate ABC transporter permease subunit [Humidesulfovibrio sp.]|uniref:molybdate ABC transporter permease subunit n=1 Tax=Humidesulfovibrio sp. TaxID=2910988 RepID=UPI002B92A1E1|nr:molybdate ABC transporter permease subunit [Humidesulfovibrio sp.]HWR03393.1 molybdate ABC transporter permease subunit [Humidesulfovibrio sp.]
MPFALLDLLAHAAVPLKLTLKVALTATAGACLTGIGAGYALSRRGLPGREVLDSICTLPLVLPPTVIGYYLLVVFGRRGIVGQWLEETFDVSLVFTWQGAALAASVVAFPLVCKAARTAFEGVDTGLENAARTLGAGEGRVFLRVSLPLAWRGIVAGTMLALARAMGEFGATLMLAGNLPGRTQTLSLAVYEAVQAGREDEAAFLVALTSLVCIVLLLSSGKLLNRNIS